MAGVFLRQSAARALGRHFTVGRSVRADHELIVSRLYRWLRHPNYAGLLLVGFGTAMMMWSPTAAGVILVGWLPLALMRIDAEERALQERLGDAFVEYRRGELVSGARGVLIRCRPMLAACPLEDRPPVDDLPAAHHDEVAELQHDGLALRRPQEHVVVDAERDRAEPFSISWLELRPKRRVVVEPRRCDRMRHPVAAVEEEGPRQVRVPPVEDA